MNARVKIATRLKGSSGALTCGNSSLLSNKQFFISEDWRHPIDVHSQEILEDDQEECEETQPRVIVLSQNSLNPRGRKT